MTNIYLLPMAGIQAAAGQEFFSPARRPYGLYSDDCGKRICRLSANFSFIEDSASSRFRMSPVSETPESVFSRTFVFQNKRF
ncbi:MAG: hypothetical protein Q4E18_12810, partial [Clostridia bacterium]|nr:hypothetical protein [Clostridia bacterium]